MHLRSKFFPRSNAERAELRNLMMFYQYLKPNYNFMIWNLIKNQYTKGYMQLKKIQVREKSVSIFVEG